MRIIALGIEAQGTLLVLLGGSIVRALRRHQACAGSQKRVQDKAPSLQSYTCVGCSLQRLGLGDPPRVHHRAEFVGGTHFALAYEDIICLLSEEIEMYSGGRHWVGVFLICGLAADVLSCSAPRHRARVQPEPRPAPAQAVPFTATAYSATGHLTASGTVPHDGIVAADPRVLPLGSRIRVHTAGQHSGEYVVRDTGSKIRGRRIDIYMPARAQAKRFGKRSVKVEVIEYGPRRPVAHRRARHAHRGSPVRPPPRGRTEQVSVVQARDSTTASVK